jgi:cob(I)alamin adenosyltransferase
MTTFDSMEAEVMSKGVIQVYYGSGHGKSTAALGDGICAASEGKSVMVIQFLKRKNEQKMAYLNRLEPEIKFFRFAKSDESFEELSESEKQEEIKNLRNGFNYSKKVVSTSACDLLILDELLGILDEKVISEDEVRDLLEGKPEEMTLICTGRVLDQTVREYADEIYHIAPEK